MRDVEAVVLDPTDSEVHSATLERLGCVVEEHSGYRVTADAIDPDYRGSVPIELARLLGGEITPARLAVASRSESHDPQDISGCGTASPDSVGAGQNSTLTQRWPEQPGNAPHFTTTD